MTSPLPFRTPGVAPAPIFERVAVVGLGLIGGSLALAIREVWPRTLIIGVDRKHVIERATLMHAIDVGADDLGMVSEADLIVLSAPISANERILRSELSAVVSRETVVTDVSGVKRPLMAAAAPLPERMHFVGGHPIAGAAEAGLDRAKADLFRERPWILCPARSDGNHRLDEFVSALGALPHVMDPGTHDRLFAFLSHLPQLSVSALMTVVGSQLREEGLKLAGAGLQDSTRLATSPPDIWKEVVALNADNMTEALEALIHTLESLKSDLKNGEVLERVFSEARYWKSKLRS